MVSFVTLRCGFKLMQDIIRFDNLKSGCVSLCRARNGRTYESKNYLRVILDLSRQKRDVRIGLHVIHGTSLYSRDKSFVA
jgi:hypothetical protein